FTSDKKWIDKSIPKDKNDVPVKVLTLEHHMAAIRMGFNNFFTPLYNVDRLKQGLLEGSLSPVNFFTKIILPLYNAHKERNKFEIFNIIKLESPIFDKENIIKETDKKTILNNAKTNVDSLLKLWDNDNHPTLKEIIIEVSKT